MQLRDLKPLCLERGREPPPEDIRFTIHCCGYTLLISDDEKWHKAIEALRKYHGMV
jgi:hypothetical protein